MRLCSSALLLLLASILPPAQGILEANYTNLKCRCLQTTSRIISTNFIERIQFIPRGNGCPQKEVIIWTKNKLAICLNPEDKLVQKWIQKVIKLLSSKMMSSTPPAPVSKRKTS